MPRKTPPRISSIAKDPNGMRTFLQRAEVRLGTMQRIAGILLSGAGLMILLSTLSGSKIVEKTICFLSKIDTHLTISFLFLFIPVIICLWLPFHFLYVLLEELFKFYFAEKLSDEVTDCNSSASKFVLPANVLPSDEANSTVLNLIVQTDGNTSGRHSLIEEVDITESLSDGNTPDRHSLIEEVGITESLLKRHTIGLKGLLFKYVKYLRVMLWTTLVLFVTPVFFNELISLQTQALAIAVWYMIWGIVILVPVLVLVKRSPRWTEQDTSGHPYFQLIKRFITEVEIYAIMAIVSEVIFILSQIEI